MDGSYDGREVQASTSSWHLAEHGDFASQGQGLLGVGGSTQTQPHLKTASLETRHLVRSDYPFCSRTDGLQNFKTKFLAMA